MVKGEIKNIRLGSCVCFYQLDTVDIRVKVLSVINWSSELKTELGEVNVL